jgi:hypothetical protein
VPPDLPGHLKIVEGSQQFACPLLKNYTAHPRREDKHITWSASADIRFIGMFLPESTLVSTGPCIGLVREISSGSVYESQALGQFAEWELLMLKFFGNQKSPRSTFPYRCIVDVLD